MYKTKATAAEKIKYVRQVISGEMSAARAAEIAGVSEKAIRLWVRNYESIGSDAFTSKGWTRYTEETKLEAVNEYLTGKGSLSEICSRHKIKSTWQLRNWIKKYNGHEKLKSTGNGETRLMTKGRRTTLDERVSIVEDCIANGRNYAETAKKHKVSYQQVYGWVRKYDNGSVDALKDRRGRTKPVSEMTELEKLRYENRMLKAENKHRQMEIDFLKKLNEVERRWGLNTRGTSPSTRP